MLSVQNLHVSVDGKEILRGVSLDIRPGEVVALMGPNGSGKSTLAYTIAGHPRYTVTSGSVAFQGRDVLSASPDARAKMGLFLSFQYPHEVPGVPFGKFLRTAYGEIHGAQPPVREFLARLDEKLALLRMEPSFVERSVNEGFSGGEKKRAEILQLAVLEPKVAILDETDSGLDVDALRTVAHGIAAIQKTLPEMAVLLITHYERFLDFLTPDRVLVMKGGQIVAEGGKDLADRIQQEGYDRIASA